jgi:hypothetical protein
VINKIKNIKLCNFSPEEIFQDPDPIGSGIKQESGSRKVKIIFQKVEKKILNDFWVWILSHKLSPALDFLLCSILGPKKTREADPGCSFRILDPIFPHLGSNKNRKEKSKSKVKVKRQENMG